MFLARLEGHKSPYAFVPVVYDARRKTYVADSRPGVPQRGELYEINDTPHLDRKIVMVFQDGNRYIFQAPLHAVPQSVHVG